MFYTDRRQIKKFHSLIESQEVKNRSFLSIAKEDGSGSA